MSRPNGQPRVSVIIPAFNASHCIARAVASVQAQTEHDWEIVIVDDASTDETAAVVARLAQAEPRILFDRLAINGGPSAARNAGFTRASGRWLALLDADDTFKPERLKALCDLAEQHGLDAIGDDLLYYDELAGVEVGSGGFVQGRGVVRVDLDDYLASTSYKVGPLEALYREEKLISLLKLVIRRDFVDAHQLRYSTRYRYCEDFLFYFDLFRANAQVGLTAEPMYVYTEKLGSISRQFSPHSRTVPNRASIIEAVDGILAADQGLSHRQQRLLQQRRASTASAIKYEALRQRFKDGDKTGFATALATNTDVWFRFLREVRYGVTARVRQRLFYKRA